MEQERLNGIQDAFQWLISSSDDYAFNGRFAEAFAQLENAQQLNEQIIKYCSKEQFEMNLKELALNLEILKQKI